MTFNFKNKVYKINTVIETAASQTHKLYSLHPKL